MSRKARSVAVGPPLRAAFRSERLVRAAAKSVIMSAAYV
jgi:hypothetical protein